MKGVGRKLIKREKFARPIVSPETRWRLQKRCIRLHGTFQRAGQRHKPRLVRTIFLAKRRETVRGGLSRNVWHDSFSIGQADWVFRGPCFCSADLAVSKEMRITAIAENPVHSFWKAWRMTMNRRTFLAASIAGAALFDPAPALAAAHAKKLPAAEGELLYNGIRLPAVWPPVGSNATLHLPSSVPYLMKRPAVVPIDMGRQLFVDDFLIEQNSLKREFHRPEYHAGGPVIRADQAWEKQGNFPIAAVYSDGVWFDPQDKLFKMWYMGGYRACTCYAVSQDGIKWEKPKLDVQAGTNIVSAADRDSAIVWLDHEEADAARRFKLFRAHREVKEGKVAWFFQIHVSRDGIHWSDVVARSGDIYPRSTVFRNPFRKVWEYGIRKDSHLQVGRCRRYFECDDVIAKSQWDTAARAWWLGADTLDIARDDVKFRPQLTNFDGVAYESLILGLFTCWRGTMPPEMGRPELNDVCVGFSRDGFHFDRPDRRAFLPMSETKGGWNWGNVQSAGGGCLVVGDKLYFYCSGRSGTPENREAGGSTGLAMLRRDGFASLQAGDVPGEMITRPITFTGKRLFVNADAKAGELRAEMLDAQGQAIAPFTLDNCVAVAADSTKRMVAWKPTADLSALAGKIVKVRFRLRNASVFAFWVSADETGKSGGFVAAGGPGLENHRDG
jgi:hypothetical protein